MLLKAKTVNRVLLLPIEAIIPNPNQPRQLFDEEKINELAQSIAQYGLLQPITVQQIDKNLYELVAGERRLMACRQLKMQEIPAIVVSMKREDSAALALIENIQRCALNYFEEALAIEKLMRLLGLTQQQIAVRLGKTQSTVANKLRLLKYPERLRTLILDCNLTERHARALLKIDTESLRQTAVEYIVKKNLNVAEAEKYISSLLYKKDRDNPDKKQMRIIKDIRVFSNTIKQAVDMMKQSGINAYAKKTENDEYIEYVVKIPKIS